MGGSQKKSISFGFFEKKRVFCHSDEKRFLSKFEGLGVKKITIEKRVSSKIKQLSEPVSIRCWKVFAGGVNN
jgi:hypothetical protein